MTEDQTWPQGKIADALRGMLRLFDEQGNFTSDFRGMQEATQRGYEALSPAMNRTAPQEASETDEEVAVKFYAANPRAALFDLKRRLEAHPQQERAEVDDAVKFERTIQKLRDLLYQHEDSSEGDALDHAIEVLEAAASRRADERGQL